MLNLMKFISKIPDSLLLFVRIGIIIILTVFRGDCVGVVYAVLSGKGGTGKSSVCAGLAAALAEAGLRVLCIDCDVGLRNLDISLGMSDCGALSFLDISEGGYPLDRAARHSVYPTLAFMTAPMNCPANQIDTAAFCRMLLDARQQFDYIFLDAAAGVDAGFQLVASGADRFLLVTGPGPAAIRDASRVGELLELSGKTDIRLIVNRVDREMLSTVRLTIDDVMDSTGLPLAGIILEDPNVTLAAAFGQPLLKHAKRCEAAKAYRRIAKRLQGIQTPIHLR